MGELRGRPDQPPEEPDKPAEADAPDPSWNKTQDGTTLWRVIQDADDRFAMPGESGVDRSRLNLEKPSPDDRPAERPPNGEELKEMDSPSASRLDRARKKAVDQGFLSDALDVTDKWGSMGGDLAFNRNPPGKAQVCVPSPVKEHAPTPHPDGGQALTGMLVVGMFIGHGVMRARRMWSENQGKA